MLSGEEAKGICGERTRLHQPRKLPDSGSVPSGPPQDQERAGSAFEIRERKASNIPRPLASRLL